jgi:hypothetical protein
LTALYKKLNKAAGKIMGNARQQLKTLAQDIGSGVTEKKTNQKKLISNYVGK